MNYRNLLKEAALEINYAKQARIGVQKVIRSAQKKTRVKGLLISTLMLILLAFVLTMKTGPTHSPLADQAPPASFYKTHVIYKDPLCSDDLIVMFAGEPVCGAI